MLKNKSIQFLIAVPLVLATLVTQTACSAGTIADIAATLVSAIANAEAKVQTNPQLQAYLGAASVCASDFAGLYANGATPTAGQAVAVAGECVIAAPDVPGESPLIAAAIAGVGIALEAISAFLPPPANAAIRATARTNPDTKLPRPFFGPYYSHKLNKAYSNAKALRIHFGR